jgi:amidase
MTLFTRTVIQSKPWMIDSTALSVPWRDVPKQKSLTIGVWSQDPEFPVFPPVARTMAEAVEKLKAAGHTIKHITAPPSSRGMKIAMRSFALDTHNLAHKFLADAGEDPHADLAAMNPFDYTDADFVPDLKENLKVSADLHDFRDDWAKIWRDGGLDVLICPAARGTAVPHGEFGPLNYTILWNLLDVSLMTHSKASLYSLLTNYYSFRQVWSLSVRLTSNSTPKMDVSHSNAITQATSTERS